MTEAQTENNEDDSNQPTQPGLNPYDKFMQLNSDKITNTDGQIRELENEMRSKINELLRKDRDESVLDRINAEISPLRHIGLDVDTKALQLDTMGLSLGIKVESLQEVARVLATIDEVKHEVRAMVETSMRNTGLAEPEPPPITPQEGDGAPKEILEELEEDDEESGNQTGQEDGNDSVLPSESGPEEKKPGLVKQFFGKVWDDTYIDNSPRLNSLNIFSEHFILKKK